MEQTLNILLESTWAASIVPFSTEATSFAMKAFGNFDMKLPFVLSVAGATAGQVFNWLVGKALLKIHIDKKLFRVSDYWHNRIAGYFNKYGIFMLLFSWMILCNMLVVAAGFLGTRFRVVLPLIIIGQTAYYGYYLLY